MSPPAFSAVVLAAGHSTRMGRDKALLPGPGGGVLWQRQRELLASAGAVEIFLSARPEQTWARTAAGFAAVVPDAVLQGGPLAGVAAALVSATHPHLAVIAVDLPLIEATWFRALLATCAPGVGAVGRNGNFFEPLAAIYPRKLLPDIQAALERRDLSLQRLLSTACTQGLMRVHEISAEEKTLFENWNEPGST